MHRGWQKILTGMKKISNAIEYRSPIFSFSSSLMPATAAFDMFVRSIKETEYKIPRIGRRRISIFRLQLLHVRTIFDCRVVKTDIIFFS